LYDYIASSLEFDVCLVCKTHIWGCISLFKCFLDREDFCFLLHKPTVNMLPKMCTKS